MSSNESATPAARWCFFIVHEDGGKCAAYVRRLEILRREIRRPRAAGAANRKNYRSSDRIEIAAFSSGTRTHVRTWMPRKFSRAGDELCACVCVEISISASRLFGWNTCRRIIARNYRYSGADATPSLRLFAAVYVTLITRRLLEKEFSVEGAKFHVKRARSGVSGIQSVTTTNTCHLLLIK